MPFGHDIEHDPNDKYELITTLYRFAEIEMNQALIVMKPLFSNEYDLLSSIIKKIAPNQAENVQSLLVNYRFKHPEKHELIRYMRYNLFSYKRITKLVQVSNREIANARLDYEPLYSAFDFWEPEMLDVWNEIKGSINLWGDALSHKKRKEDKTYDLSTDYIPYEPIQTINGNGFDDL